MNLGIRAHDMERLPVEELVANIRKKGFTCTQLALKKAISEFNTDKGAMTPGLAQYLKGIFQSNQVDVAVLGCYLNLATPNQMELINTLKTYEAHIRFASQLGCGVVGTETGAVNESYSFEEANHSKEALQIFIKHCREVVSYAEKMGVIFAIEPVYKHIVCNVKRAKQVLDAVNSPNLRIIYDPVNTISIYNYENQDSMMEEAFDLLGDAIDIIHAKDFIVKENDILSVPSGQGMFHMDVLMKYVKQRKPHIHVLLEDTKPDNALAVRDFVLKQYENA